MDNFHVAAANALTALIALAMIAAIIIMTVGMVRDAIATRRREAARQAKLASPEYVAAVEAARAAWDAVNASRNADGRATVNAMNAYRAAARTRDALARY